MSTNYEQRYYDDFWVPSLMSQRHSVLETVKYKFKFNIGANRKLPKHFVKFAKHCLDDVTVEDLNGLAIFFNMYNTHKKEIPPRIQKIIIDAATLLKRTFNGLRVLDPVITITQDPFPEIYIDL
jgi:hypothetical protein